MSGHRPVDRTHHGADIRCMQHLPQGTPQAGVSLIELIVALAIISLISATLVVAVHQLLNRSVQANDQQYAISQLRQAEHYITRDILMADEVSSTGFPLLVRWDTEDADNDLLLVEDVAYELQGADSASLQLVRATSTAVYDVTDPNPLNWVLISDGPPTSIVVAQGIANDASQSFCVCEANENLDDPSAPPYAGIVTVTLVARTGNHEALRVFEVEPRTTLATVMADT